MTRTFLVLAAAVVAVGVGAVRAASLLANRNATHACLVHAGLKTSYVSADEQIGTMGRLSVAFSAAERAQLAFERTAAKAQKDSRDINKASRALGFYAGGYAIRNVAIWWTQRPSLAEKSAVLSCIKP